MGRRYGHGKTSTSHFESEDVWITALVYGRGDVAVVGVDDGWIIALDNDTVEADELGLYR